MALKKTVNSFNFCLCATIPGYKVSRGSSTSTQLDWLQRPSHTAVAGGSFAFNRISSCCRSTPKPLLQWTSKARFGRHNEHVTLTFSCCTQRSRLHWAATRQLAKWRDFCMSSRLENGSMNPSLAHVKVDMVIVWSQILAQATQLERRPRLLVISSRTCRGRSVEACLRSKILSFHISLQNLLSLV